VAFRAALLLSLVVHLSCAPGIPSWTEADAALVASGPPDNPFVQAVGRELFDGDGERIRLRGVNLGGWLLWEGWMIGGGHSLDGERVLRRRLVDVIGANEATSFVDAYQDAFVGEADLRAIASLGLNVVRVPINHTVLEVEPEDENDEAFTPRPEGFARLDDLLARCQGASLRVIFDLHAAPGGQSGAFMADPDDGPRLFQHPPFQTRTIALWRAIAERYADSDVVAGYDLINEPDPPSHEALMDLYVDIAAAIREVDPFHLILLEGTSAASDLSPFSRAVTWNQAYTVHQYTFFGDWRSDELARWAAVSDAHRVPLWVGEFGIADPAVVADSVARYDDVDGPVQGFALWSWKVADAGDDHPCLVESGERWRTFAGYLNRGGFAPSRADAQLAIEEGLPAFGTCTIVPSMAEALGASTADVAQAQQQFE